MNKTKVSECDTKIMVNIKDLQNMLSIGLNSAARIGEEAGAVIRIGRRKLYNVRKIIDYLESKGE